MGKPENSVLAVGLPLWAGFSRFGYHGSTRLILKKILAGFAFLCLFGPSVALASGSEITDARPAEAGVADRRGAVSGASPRPMMFYVEIHIDSVIKNDREFILVTENLQKLASILEKHGARGSFMFLDIYPRYFIEKFPTGKNLIADLEKRGHEIGAHMHTVGPQEVTVASTIRALKAAGASEIVSLTSPFHVAAVNERERKRFKEGEQELRARIVVDDMAANGITSAMRWCLSSPFPYTPSKDNWMTRNIEDCDAGDGEVSDPNGKIVAVGNYNGAGYLFSADDCGFAITLAKLKIVLAGHRVTRPRYFPMAIHDHFFLNPSGQKAENRIVAFNESRWEMFDGFLSSLDALAAKGEIRYVTRKEVPREYWEFVKETSSIDRRPAPNPR